jgi:hypothetical protein
MWENGNSFGGWIVFRSSSDCISYYIFDHMLLSFIAVAYLNLLTNSDFQPYWLVIKSTSYKSTVLLLRECHKSLVKCYRQGSQIMLSLGSSRFMDFWNHSKYKGLLPPTKNILRVLKTLTTIILLVVVVWNFRYRSQEYIAKPSDHGKLPISVLVPLKMFEILKRYKQ